MAHNGKLEKEKTAIKGPDCCIEEIVVQVSTTAKFYQLVQLFNLYFGHGNWTTAGRPLRRLRRVDYFNKHSFITPLRTIDVTFKYPGQLKHCLSRIFLELQ